MVTISQMQYQIAYAHQKGTLPLFAAASRTTGLSEALLLALASRESGIGSNPYYISHNGVGSDGKSVGIMQINKYYFPAATVADPLNNAKIIPVASGYLKGLIGEFSGNLRYGLDAYNAGSGAIKTALASGLDPDQVTTGGNYGRDVLARVPIITQILQQYPQSNQAPKSNTTFLTLGLVTLLVGVGWVTSKRM